MNAIVETLLEIVKLILPALVVFLTVYVLLKQYLDKQYQLRALELRKGQQEVSLPLKLQAYERLSLFCERIDLPNLVLRVREEGMSAGRLRLALMLAIQQEYEHNITQQVYVSDKLWQIIKAARDNAIDAISMISESVEPDADGRLFARALLDLHQRRNGSGPETALQAVKKEASLVL